MGIQPASPLPWRVSIEADYYCTRHIELNGKPVLTEYAPKVDRLRPADELLQELVHAANNHAALVEELAFIVQMCESIGTFENGVVHEGKDEGDVLARQALDRARAVLAAAKGVKS